VTEQQNKPQDESTELQPIDIFFPDEIKKGVYSNTAYINHTPEEIVLDFLNVFPSIGNGSVVSRVMLSPSHAKRLARALQETIEKHEEKYGEVPHTIKPLDK